MSEQQSETKCDHKFVHLDTKRYIRTNEASMKPEQYRVDRFFCERCSEIRERIEQLS